jgi:hypothetical protein
MIKDDGWKIIYVRFGFLAVLIQGDLFKHSKPSGYFIHHKGLTLVYSSFCLHGVFMCFVVDVRTNSDCFPIQN